ncbi:MAG: chemotaxis protein [Telmatospirillum sp.]|nr:chemotaxis protein [Telmatospirillum sp.]
MIGYEIGADWTLPAIGSAVLAGTATINWWIAAETQSSRYTISAALIGLVLILIYEFAGHPWQIDMHMYFFAALAIVTAFCDWRVLVLAAAIGALHHGLLTFALPAAVFPAGPSLGRLLIHSAIALVETGVLIWVARRLTAAFAGARDAVDAANAAQQQMRQATADRDRMAHESARSRKADMMALAQTFENRVSASMQFFTTAAGDMNGAARIMSDVADKTSSQVRAVADAARQASTNVGAVAAAAEDLSVSISEISRQVAQASRTSRSAEDRAAETSRVACGLADAVERIGQVVSLINVIASQTNLLALNATIEAARAGEAGRGFAVVAGEVKGLAEQTAKATGEIAGQIESVQAATAEVVRAIDDICKTIVDISAASAAIASAVEQQQAAAREIARNVEQASAGTDSVAGHVADVDDGAAQTGSAAKHVLEAAVSLGRQVAALQSQVEVFLSGIRSENARA